MFSVAQYTCKCTINYYSFATKYCHAHQMANCDIIHVMSYGHANCKEQVTQGNTFVELKELLVNNYVLVDSGLHEMGAIWLSSCCLLLLAKCGPIHVDLSYLLYTCIQR
jgi:hypothetical protein